MVSHSTQTTFDDGAEDAIPVTDKIARSLIPRERLCAIIALA